MDFESYLKSFHGKCVSMACHTRISTQTGKSSKQFLFSESQIMTKVKKFQNILFLNSMLDVLKLYTRFLFVNLEFCNYCENKLSYFVLLLLQFLRISLLSSKTWNSFCNSMTLIIFNSIIYKNTKTYSVKHVCYRACMWSRLLFFVNVCSIFFHCFRHLEFKTVYKIALNFFCEKNSTGNLHISYSYHFIKFLFKHIRYMKRLNITSHKNHRYRCVHHKISMNITEIFSIRKSFWLRIIAFIDFLFDCNHFDPLNRLLTKEKYELLILLFKVFEGK